ncbi:MAG: sigma-70 family RNA polymerase sigma factor [Thermoleophilaceae bacterium]|nr:sigma-70 family RNA polymerase sigma factor [Thermoleophilaceae bacterium]
MQQQPTSTSETDRDYLARVVSKPPLPAPVEKRLFAQLAKGDAAAREALVLHNTRLITRAIVAIPNEQRQHQLGPITPGGLEYTDLFNQGYVALTNAINMFNPARGVPFDVYAGTAIKNELSKALNNLEDQVRLPAQAAQLERQIFRIEDRRKLRGVTTPLSDEQLSEMTGATLSMVKNVRTAPRVVTSLQTPTETGTELGTLLADTTPDEQLADEDTSILDHFTPERVNTLLDSIKPKYADPIRKHYLEGKSLETTAQETGVSATTTAKNIRHGIGQLRRVAKTQINEHQASTALQAVASKGAASL